MGLVSLNVWDTCVSDGTQASSARMVFVGVHLVYLKPKFLNEKKYVKNKLLVYNRCSQPFSSHGTR